MRGLERLLGELEWIMQTAVDELMETMSAHEAEPDPTLIAQAARPSRWKTVALASRWRAAGGAGAPEAREPASTPSGKSARAEEGGMELRLLR